MKLSARDAAAFIARPDPARCGALLYGPDGMRVALKRQDFLKALLGPGAEEEMRLTRLNAGEVRKDPALLLDAVKAVGFFSGQRAVLVEEANDAIVETVAQALDAWVTGDAQLAVTAGALKPTSKLRKVFEGHRNACAIGIYDNPPTREDIAQTLREAGLTEPEGSAMAALGDLAQTLDPGDFRQTVEKIALYKLSDPQPLSPEEVAACAPASTDADVDDVLMVVADANARDVGPMMRRLAAQGATPVTLCIGALRYFRTLHRAATDRSGRPAIFGPNRDRMLAQARRWSVVDLEQSISMLVDTDLQLRSAGQNAPGMALVERVFIRLAMLGRR